MTEELAFKDVFYLDRCNVSGADAWMLLMPEIPTDNVAVAPLLGLKLSFQAPSFGVTEMDYLYGKQLLVASIKDHEAIIRVRELDSLVSFGAQFVNFEINEFNEQSFVDLEKEYRESAALLIAQFNTLKAQLAKTLEIGHEVVKRAASHTELSSASMRQYHRQQTRADDVEIEPLQWSDRRRR